ncbi:thioredoxin domain-containing protein [uncultured Parasphingorhabdus sp.]|uniref:DsbA family protein n=1 Tax=uncultured Parasphingorhabdus sp. TaxID=2709694 RepID=UPI0030D92269|tara:strand:- start:4937 stop:5620 length:684 start_codon:yes stop_codon:yes gene_type:complete
MNLRSAYLASALVAATVIAVPASAQQADRVTLSAMGGHVMGNPLAKHKLTEYMSYTCSHCAAFEKDSHAALTTDFVNKSRISFEVRNLVLNPIDLSAAMLARCGGRTKFFGNHRALLLKQSTWLTKFQATSPEVMKTMNEGTVPQRLKKIVKAAGLDTLMKGRGFTASQIDACLSNQAEQDKILAMTKYATDTLKLSGTPSFTLADQPLAEVHSWTALKPKLTTLPQ